MEGSLYIVDALNYLYRAFHALPPLATTKGMPTGALYGLCQMLLKIEREHRPTHLCVVFDAPGKSFRDTVYADYKAHRPPMPPELSVQIDLVHRVVDAFGLATLSVPGYEADDVIATLTRKAIALGMRVMICSSDKDLMQLVGDGVSVLDTMKNRTLGPPEVEEKFGVPPRLVPDVLALMGDSIDNVPGVDGIGPKTAAELIRKFGSLDGLLARLGKEKIKKEDALLRSRDAIQISRKLVALDDAVALPVELSALSRREPDSTTLASFFREFEFTRLLANLQNGSASPPAPSVPAGSAPPAPSGAATAASAGGSASTLAALFPLAGEASAGDAPAAAPAPSAPPPPATLVTDAAGLAALVSAIKAAGAFALMPLTEGGDATRAAFVGLGIALSDGARFYVPLGHRLLGAPPCLPEPDVLAALGPALASASVGKHLHDAKLLEVMLDLRGHRLAGVVWDSLIAAYMLDAAAGNLSLSRLAAAGGLPDVALRAFWLGSGRTSRSPNDVPADEAGRYIAHEAATVLALATRQRAALDECALLSLYETVELPLARVLARIERWGVRLDADHLRRLGEEVERSVRALEEEIWKLAGTTFNIGSPKQLAQVLFERLQLPVVRRTKTGPSTDADVLEELATLHDVPAKILEYRSLTKLKGTYIDALPALVNPRTGRLHTTFNQAVAATGRLSSSEPNLQNIPIRSELGRRIREAFIADPGHVIVSADYSQIELRILAHFSADAAFLEAFRSGEDIHQRTAAEVFSVPPKDVTPEQRRIAKAINFGLVFGQSDFGLAQTLRIPRATARAYIDSYFQRYAGVKGYMDRAISEARTRGVVTTLLGRRRALPEINSKRMQDRNYAERIARNTPIQGSAADLLKLAMIRVDRGLAERWPGARLLLTVHDELVFEVPESSSAAFATWVKAEMEAVASLGVEPSQGSTPPAKGAAGQSPSAPTRTDLLSVPLVVDVGAGRTWGQAH